MSTVKSLAHETFLKLRDDIVAGRIRPNERLIAGDLAEELKLPATGGLLVQEVARGSAAESAGLKGYRDVVVVGNMQLGIGGDFITSIDGKAVTEPDAVTRSIARKRPGDIVELKVFRGGRTIDLKVKLGEVPEERF